MSAHAAVANTARVFGREYARLQHLRSDAAIKGELVTASRVELEFQQVGSLLTARDGSVLFDSEPKPVPLPVQAAEQPEPVSEPPAKPEPPADKPAAKQPQPSLPKTSNAPDDDAPQTPPKLDAKA